LGTPLPDDLKLARWDGTTWNVQVIDYGRYYGVGCSNSLAFNLPAGCPAISYRDDDSRDLKYACWNGTAWNIKTVEDEVDVTSDNSLAFDSGGNPAITCYDSTNSDLKYAWWDGSLWHTETVDNNEQTGRFPSLVIGPSDERAISYINQENSYLMCARWDGSAWQIETVDSRCGATGASLSFDPAGYPAISYGDPQEGALKLAWRHDWGYRILRGESVPSLAAIADGVLTWTDPEPVLTDPFPDLLFYQAESIPVTHVTKEGLSLTIHCF
jgi:hypothetical protein